MTEIEISTTSGTSSDDAPTLETRHRLLEAAGEIFAEHGFKAATIRDICARANANVAAINYHFRDKEGLYRQTFDYWVQAAVQEYPPDLNIRADDPPQTRLRAYIWSFVHRALSAGRNAIHGKLIAREMVDYTGILEQQMDALMRPSSEILAQIIRDFLGPQASDEDLRFGYCCVVGPIVFHRQARYVIDRFMPAGQYDPAGLDRLTDYLTTTAAAGLRQASRQIQARSG